MWTTAIPVVWDFSIRLACKHKSTKSPLVSATNYQSAWTKISSTSLGSAWPANWKYYCRGLLKSILNRTDQNRFNWSPAFPNEPAQLAKTHALLSKRKPGVIHWLSIRHQSEDSLPWFGNNYDGSPLDGTLSAVFFIPSAKLLNP